MFFFQSSSPHRDLHSFPTRRSSDLPIIAPKSTASRIQCRLCAPGSSESFLSELTTGAHSLHWIRLDRKSTRLNSSHQIISYAVFCLKKKKKKKENNYISI